jgi:maltooligosyltrehalose trehalohydrolase
MTASFPWWYPVGAQLQKTGAAFRVWAGAHARVSVVINDRVHPLKAQEKNYFYGYVPEASEGGTYAFLIDDKGPFPDPASRFQPQGPHGPSQIIDPENYAWKDSEWPGVELSGQVIYEMHIGTFTQEGTWRAAIQELPKLAELGVTLIELMPVAEFDGRHGWGYDGVDLFAPTRNYGQPDDFRAFVDAAHSHRIGVILDVVYNHLGPSGNYLSEFSTNYFTNAYKTDWGAAINFDGPESCHVRQFYSANAAYWVSEYHLDGLRLDATQNIYDRSKDHIIAEFTKSARKAAGRRNVLIVAENEPQETKLIRPIDEGGYGIDAMWNDDFHHSTIVAATGQRGAYYADYLGSSQELLSALKYGFLYQGQWYSWQKQRRGTSTLGTNPAAMVSCLQNHDQIANSGRGLRLHELTSKGRYKALTAFLLLGPATPMLFQGEEFASSAPFLFFADHKAELADQVRQGRKEFLHQWRSLATGELEFDDPCAVETFEKCKLDFSERLKNKQIYDLHHDLLRLRSSEPVFSRQDRQFDGAILSPEAFVVRFFTDGFADDKLLVVNLGVELHFSVSPIPLLAPVADTSWTVQWSTEDPRYGGSGTAALDTDLNWTIPGHATVILKPGPKNEQAVSK